MTAVSDPVAWIRVARDNIETAEGWPDHECQVHAETGECPHEPLWRLQHSLGLTEIDRSKVAPSNTQADEQVHGKPSPWLVMTLAAVAVLLYFALIAWTALV